MPRKRPRRRRLASPTGAVSLTIRLPEETKGRLEIIAREDDLTVSQLVRRAVQAALEPSAR